MSAKSSLPAFCSMFVRHGSDMLCLDASFLLMFLRSGCAAAVHECSNWDGMYVLYTYAAKRQTARNVQLLLSNPEAGSEDKILRHITLCRL
jgi:hypothetical protein